MKTTWKSHKTEFISFVFSATNYMLSKKKKMRKLIGQYIRRNSGFGIYFTKDAKFTKDEEFERGEREREREETNGLLYAKPIGVFQISFLNVYFLI